MTSKDRALESAKVARAAIATLIAVGILVVGATAPRHADFIPSAEAGVPAVQANGPTGYFPDMFVNQGTGNEPQPEAF